VVRCWCQRLYSDSKLDYYDIDNDQWATDLPDTRSPRDHTGGALIAIKICIAGGHDGGDPSFSDRVIN